MRSSADLIDFTRFLIGEKTSRYFRNGHLNSCLSASQNRIAALLRKADAGFFETYEDYTMVVDQRNYDLPSFFKSPLYVERIDGNYANDPREVTHRRIASPAARASDTTWDIKGDEIMFYPTPQSTTPQYRLWYSYYLPDLLYCHLDSGSDQNTIVLASSADTEDDYRLAVPVDDYYNDLTVEMISGDESGETAVVSDYDGDTRTLELDVGFSGSPGSGEIISSHIQIPEDMWESMALLAAHLSRARDREGRYIYGREFIESLKYVMPEAQLRLGSQGAVHLYSIDGVV